MKWMFCIIKSELKWHKEKEWTQTWNLITNANKIDRARAQWAQVQIQEISVWAIYRAFSVL